MTTHLQYAEQRELHVDQAHDVSSFRAPLGCDPSQVAEAVQRAVRSPLGYPPLDDCVFAGDRVAIALEEGLPQAAGIVRGICQVLADSGVQGGDTTLLQTKADVEAGAGDPTLGLPAGQVQRVIHDPRDVRQMAFLAHTRAGRPVFLHRALIDADLVIAVGCGRLSGSVGYHGLHGVVFPTFADWQAQAWMRQRHAGRISRRERLRARRCADEAAWLLGARFAVQAIPAGQGRVLDVLAGDADALRAPVQTRMRDAWEFRAPQPAELVIAAIDGPPQQQTWLNLARALATAARVVVPQGAILVCCGSLAEPGPALRMLMQAEDPQQVVPALLRQNAEDLLAARRLLLAQEQARVYLLGRLPASVAEELGMVAVADEAEARRLIAHSGSCLVIPAAQYARVRIDEP
jgi:hypothetical protein